MKSFRQCRFVLVDYCQRLPKLLGVRTHAHGGTPWGADEQEPEPEADTWGGTSSSVGRRLSGKSATVHGEGERMHEARAPEEEEERLFETLEQILLKLMQASCEGKAEGDWQTSECAAGARARRSRAGEAWLVRARARVPV